MDRITSEAMAHKSRWSKSGASWTTRLYVVYWCKDVSSHTTPPTSYDNDNKTHADHHSIRHDPPQHPPQQLPQQPSRPPPQRQPQQPPSQQLPPQQPEQCTSNKQQTCDIQPNNITQKETKRKTTSASPDAKDAERDYGTELSTTLYGEQGE